MPADHAMDLSGTRMLSLIVGPKMGRGAFGEIYSAINVVTGTLWAVKTESVHARRKVLEFEFHVLCQIQSSPYFARVGVFGRSTAFSFFSMERLGPSLGALLARRDRPGRFSLSTGVRAAYHLLKCLESFHRFGFVHRDVKPGNVLTREGADHPLCLIDFGLARSYISRDSGQHLPARARAGFRGTVAYASRHAHLEQDLSRRDDLISWFYVAFELTVGPLPWRGAPRRAHVLAQKDAFDVRRHVAGAPELFEAWRHIANLAFADTPNYTFVYHQLLKIVQNNGVEMGAPFDWADALRADRAKTADALAAVAQRRTLLDVADVSAGARMDDPLLPVASPVSHESEAEACGCC
jgi:serine/threonine protein kinase